MAIATTPLREREREGPSINVATQRKHISATAR